MIKKLLYSKFTSFVRAITIMYLHSEQPLDSKSNVKKIRLPKIKRITIEVRHIVGVPLAAKDMVTLTHNIIEYIE